MTLYQTHSDIQSTHSAFRKNRRVKLAQLLAKTDVNPFSLISVFNGSIRFFTRSEYHLGVNSLRPNVPPRGPNDNLYKKIQGNLQNEYEQIFLWRYSSFESCWFVDVQFDYLTEISCYSAFRVNHWVVKGKVLTPFWWRKFAQTISYACQKKLFSRFPSKSILEFSL